MMVMLPCFLSVLVEDLARRPAPHVVAVVAPPVVVGDEPGIDLCLELADRGEVPAVESRSPALFQDRAVEALADGVVVGRAGRDPLVTEALRRQVGPEPAGHVLGTIVAEHGSHPDPVAPVVPEDLVDEADRVGGRDRSQHDHATTAQRVNTSTAVSWYTLPTPFSFPM